MGQVLKQTAGLTTYDAKDPDTKYPPIEPLRPPKGAPNKDWTPAHDLAKDMPEKLHELQRLWLIEAVKYNVVPLDDRMVERANPDLAGHPQLVHGHRQMLFGGMKGLSPWSVVSFMNKSVALTAEVVVPESGAEGVIFAWGGLTGGFSLVVLGVTAQTTTPQRSEE